MSRPNYYSWPVPDPVGICKLQSTSGAANLLLNGDILVSEQWPGRAVLGGNARTVSLTSANNLSGVSVTIKGLINGQPISETITGPNSDTVETTILFEEVLSVHVSGAVNGIEVGSGTSGRTPWSNYDYNLIYNFVNWQVDVTGTINYTINVTSDDIASNSSPFLSAIVANQTADYYGGGFFLSFTYTSVFINSSGPDGSLTEIFMQQGTL